MPQYKFLEEEIPDVFRISAIERKHVKPLLNKIFELLPTPHTRSEVASTAHPGGKNQAEAINQAGYPLLNIDAKIFIAEIIREKVFLMMGEEIPYTATVIVDEIAERTKTLTYIKARILTTNDRYKKMLIGAGGRKIKEIGSFARKEVALATSKKIFLDLTVEVDPHWQDTYYK